MAPEPFREKIHMAKTVQSRQNHSAWFNRACEIVHGALQRVTLQPEQDQIVRLVDRIGRDDLGIERQIAMRADNPEAARLNLFRASRPYQKRHVAASRREASAEISSYRTRSNHKNPHTDELLVGAVGLRLSLMLQIALAFGDPRRARLVLQVMPEPLKDAPLIIDLVRLLAQTVILALIHNQDHVLPRPARYVVQLNALMIKHGAFRIA